jgi:histidine kinase-like protein
MNNKKVDFIADLLKSKKISANDKERLFSLSVLELKAMSNSDIDLRKDIDELKQIVYSRQTELPKVEVVADKIVLEAANEKRTDTDIDIKLPEITYESVNQNEGHGNKTLMTHAPKTVTEFLDNFRQNTDLKWTTHNWDETKYDTIQDFIDGLNASKEYQKLFSLNVRLYNLINYFIYSPKTPLDDAGVPKYGWEGLGDIKIGWQFPSSLLIAWSRENYDNKEQRKYPFEYDLPKGFRPKRPVKGKMIQTFENVVDLFKTEIQFRDHYLYDELNKRRSRMKDFSIIGLESFPQLDFYTYTRGVLGAIDEILQQVKKNETHKTIIFSQRVSDDRLIIDITHADSFPSRMLNTKNLSSFLGGGLQAIAEQLFSLCNFSVLSKFKNEENSDVSGELCITYNGTLGELNGKSIVLKTSPTFKALDSVPVGFTYRLSFYL